MGCFINQLLHSKLQCNVVNFSIFIRRAIIFVLFTFFAVRSPRRTIKFFFFFFFFFQLYVSLARDYLQMFQISSRDWLGDIYREIKLHTLSQIL